MRISFYQLYLNLEQFYLLLERIFSISFSFPQAKNTISYFALHFFIISLSDSSLKNFPTGPLPFISLSFSIVKYAKPDAPCSFAHLSILSKKLLGLSLVFLVILPLTTEPFLTNFLNISNFTSSRLNISVKFLND